ncbi:MAG: nucleotidyltransferase family protein [Bacteroidetes Order II. Incertae sedis bacterium]|nr:nucleotidyltransferase family protein [Bacteroidetes Order II. bacterium]
MTLFVLSEKGELVGTLTDGDVRRGLLAGLTVNAPVTSIMRTSFRYLKMGDFTLAQVDEIRKAEVSLIPLLNQEGCIEDVIDLSKKRSVLPCDVVMMAGGLGIRLRPLTLDKPKPMLPVGNKPIIEHNIDRLISFGIYNFTISIKYLGEQIAGYFKDGRHLGVQIQYLIENEPLGTIGSVSQISAFKNDYVLVMNSDILTTIDFEEMFRTFIEKEADMMVATVPYEVKVPYGVLETNEDDAVLSLKEKPIYTYYANAGIYLMKRKVLEFIPQNTFFNTTDLMDVVIAKGMKLSSYPILGYWLDIGQMEDYHRAQHDIKHLQL